MVDLAGWTYLRLRRTTSAGQRSLRVVAERDLDVLTRLPGRIPRGGLRKQCAGHASGADERIARSAARPFVTAAGASAGMTMHIDHDAMPSPATKGQSDFPADERRAGATAPVGYLMPPRGTMQDGARTQLRVLVRVLAQQAARSARHGDADRSTTEYGDA
jgi:hypothetical protein